MNQDKTTETPRQVAIHTILFMVNSLLTAGHILAKADDGLKKINTQLHRALKISNDLNSIPEQERLKQAERINAMLAIYANIHWGNFVCVQNVGPYAHFLVSLMDECGCAECIDAKAEFLKDHTECMDWKPKLTGPRSNWSSPATCPCAACKQARALGQASQHFAA